MTTMTSTKTTPSTLADVRGNRTIYSWVNAAAFNRSPSGDYGPIFLDRAKRDAALAEFRSYAVSRGLSDRASMSGIYPVKMTVTRFLKEHSDTLPDAFGVEA